jgi:1-deoxy-D-xylulose-5-phosphate synthase
MRYPKTAAETVDRPESSVELGKAEVHDWGRDGMLVAYGSLFGNCVKAAEKLQADGLDVGVINARFVKPLDTETLLRAVNECGFVLAIEENTITGGFGSALLEAANAAGTRTGNIHCLGIPDQFVEHGEREELLADLGLDVAGIVRTAQSLASPGSSRDETTEVLDSQVSTN